MPARGTARRLHSSADTIPAISDQLTIDVVRGGVDDATAEALRAFWAQHADLDDAAAEQRVPEVVALLREPGGAVAGACSVFAAPIALLADRRLFVLRSLLPGAARERFFDLFAAAHAALDAEYDGADGDPIGLCALLEEPERSAPAEAEWEQPRTIYAGYLADGRQLRVAYFDGRPLDRACRLGRETVTASSRSPSRTRCPLTTSWPCGRARAYCRRRRRAGAWTR